MILLFSCEKSVFLESSDKKNDLNENVPFHLGVLFSKTKSSSQECGLLIVIKTLRDGTRLPAHGVPREWHIKGLNKYLLILNQ